MESSGAEPGSGDMTDAVARAMDERTFSDVVLPEVDVLLRVARTLVGRPADAEDLVQETLVRAYRSIGSFDGAHPRAWLLTIMRNAHRNLHRRRRPSLLGAGEAPPEVPAPPADAGVEAMFDAVLVRALDDLSPRHRAVVDLVDVGGLTYAEAGAVLGVPAGTIMSRLARARTKLRASLTRDGLIAAGRTR
jgi:RNA polymerase sigma-70 factor (ECF subfamily)